MTLADIGDDLRYFLHNKSFILTTAGFTCFSFFSGGVSWWAPTVFENAIRLQQEYGLEPNVPVDKYDFVELEKHHHKTLVQLGLDNTYAVFPFPTFAWNALRILMSSLLV